MRGFPSGQYITSISDLDGLSKIQITSHKVEDSELLPQEESAHADTSSSSPDVHAQGHHLVASC